MASGSMFTPITAPSHLDRTKGRAQANYFSQLDQINQAYQSGNLNYAKQHLEGHLPGMLNKAQREYDEALGLKPPRATERASPLQAALMIGGTLAGGYGLASAMGGLGAAGAAGAAGAGAGAGAAGAGLSGWASAIPTALKVGGGLLGKDSKLGGAMSTLGSIGGLVGGLSGGFEGGLDGILSGASDFLGEDGADLLTNVSDTMDGWSGDDSIWAADADVGGGEFGGGNVYDGEYALVEDGGAMDMGGSGTIWDSPLGGSTTVDPGVFDLEDAEAGAAMKDAAKSGGGGLLGQILGPVAKTLGITPDQVLKGLGAIAGGVTNYRSGQQAQANARQAIDLGKASRDRFQSLSTNPSQYTTDMGPMLDQVADIQARRWSRDVGNPVNSPLAAISSRQDMASILFDALNKEKGLQAAVGYGQANPAAGLAALTSAQRSTNEGVGGSLGALAQILAGNTRGSGSDQILDFIRNNPWLFQGRGA